MQLFDRLQDSRNGAALLFCGAGFTADCLNFSETDGIGAGAQLLSLFNANLNALGRPSGYRNVKNAADEYENAVGEHGMMSFLKDRFQIKNITDDISEILRFPWSRVYTTNYDDGIERGLSVVGRKYNDLNNTDTPEPISGVISVVHLHGYIRKWNINNFKNSCILGADSYLGLPGVTDWLRQFRDDVERSDMIAFIGFNADDFHLNQAIFDLSSLKEKIVFINRPAASPDLDIKATQARFGEPLFIGRHGFAEMVRATLAKAAPQEPALASFQRYIAPPPSTGVPPVSDIEDLFLFGRFERRHLARDIVERKSDYHINRDLHQWSAIDAPGAKGIYLIVGEVCEGKTLLLEKLCLRLASRRPVFVLRNAYDSLLDEFASISALKTDSVFVLENCFDLWDDRLLAIARMCDAAGHILIMTARNIAAEAEPARIDGLEALSSFRRADIPPLSDQETDTLIGLVDQIAGWRNTTLSKHSEKRKYINSACKGRLQMFLLKLLKSQYVRDKYLEEYHKIEFLSADEKFAIIAALYISHIGHDVPVSFLSNALEFDVGGAVDRMTSGGHEKTIRLVHRAGAVLKTVPAIGSTNILEHMVSDRDIVDSLLRVMDYFADQVSLDDYEDHLYRQMMRYSILRGVVSSEAEVDRFFDNISKINFYRRKSLFWLQWHMAKTDFLKFVDAEKYLDQGYKEAADYEKRSGRRYNRNQLDDQKAKFLMKRATHVARDHGALFRDFSESLDIVERLIQGNDITHHPFETLKLVCLTYEGMNSRLVEAQRRVCQQRMHALTERAKVRLASVPKGFQSETAARALDQAQKLLVP